MDGSGHVHTNGFDDAQPDRLLDSNAYIHIDPDEYANRVFYLYRHRDIVGDSHGNPYIDGFEQHYSDPGVLGNPQSNPGAILDAHC